MTDPRIDSTRGMTDWGRIVALEALVVALCDREPGDPHSPDRLSDLIAGRMLHYGLVDENVRHIAQDTAEMIAGRLSAGDRPFDETIA